MPYYCSVIGCASSGRKYVTKQISYHRFPLTDKKLQRQWLDFVKRENFVPNVSSKLCSLHFEESCFEYQNHTNRKQLKRDAVPTIVSKSSTSSPKVYVLSSVTPLPSSSVMTTSLINAPEFVLPDQGESASVVEPDAEVEILNPLEDNPPTDNELFLSIQEVILNSSLENMTVQKMIEGVYEQFPHHDLTHRHKFIKDNVKKIIP